MRVIKGLVGLALVLGFAGGAFLWLRDEPSSAEVQQWLQQARSKPAQSAAYVFLAGLDAPLRHSPAALGAARLQAYEQWLASQGPAQGFQPAAQATLLLPAGDEFCSIEAPTCFTSLLQRQERLPQVLAEHAALLSRYRYFLHLQDYRTLSSPGLSEPLPPLLYLARAQQLLSLQALQLALAGEGKAALALLEEDQAGIRRQLGKADQLVMKMTLVAMLNRNLEWLVRLHRAGMVPRPTPVVRLRPAERSLGLAMQREFLLGAVMLENLREEDIPSLLEEASLWLDYKPQMTINASLMPYRQVIQLSRTEPAAFAALVHKKPQLPVPNTGLRNRVGNILLDIAGADFVEYVGRVQDLDSKIKLVNLSLQLPSGSVTAAQLVALPHRGNPYYAKQPPRLDKQGRMCFDGPLPQKDSGRCVQL
ncbi:hypothetical protein HNE05_18230 [Aquipseudomonas campi]|uniref:Uncharacterized protein n=1 Tax=Aquipseudomonas campi TaxID=2731681 RepID=A0A6M8FMN8_9GAMM|nr:hypothetical protein [Pseudomonas campi]QKE65210.1 hypothetical protein HNE05_18230 [Pseudomonas campi]